MREPPKSLSELQAEHPIPPRGMHDPLGEHTEASGLRNYIRDLVLGFNDGIVSVYALVAGLAGAGFTGHSVAVAGLAAILAGALSMGLGEYVSTKSQSQYYEAEARREREHIRTYPQLEREELREMLVAKSYPPAMIDDLVEHLASKEDRFVDFMMREEFGVGKESDRSAVAAMLLIMVAFVAGSILAVVPFALFSEARMGLAVASAASMAGLFAAGAAKGRVSGLNPYRSGLEMALLGAAAAIVTFLVGQFVGLSTA
ncbi:MAG TPA: VIT1/CCC1 transporter family protein [Candidatus Thermoplasmatota archaeon]|nr:VIT1/CCC1 transporter family protein [Candidatus Thermoplasmatota archaeon]